MVYFAALQDRGRGRCGDKFVCVRGFALALLDAIRRKGMEGGVEQSPGCVSLGT